MKQTKAFASTAGVTLLRDNQGTPARGMSAYIAPTYATGFQFGDIRRCFLSDTEVGALTANTQVEDFSAYADDAALRAVWSQGAPTSISLVGGRMRIAPAGGWVSRSWPTVIGKTYRISVTITAGSSTIRLGTTVAGVAYGQFTAITTGTHRGVFTATGTSFWATPYADATLTNEFSSFVLEEIVADRSYRSAAASVTGTITRAQLASGTSLVGYSGFSAANYLREPYSADLDFGTGEWTASAWVNVTTARTNLLSSTEQFETGTWTTWGKPVGTILNATTPPPGVLSASKLYPLSTGLEKFLVTAVGGIVPAGASNVCFFFAKKAEKSVAYITDVGGSPDRVCYFDLNTGVATLGSFGSSPFMVDVGDGWWICGYVRPTNAQWFEVGVADAVGSTFVTANGTDGIFIGGTQINIGTVRLPYQRVVTGSEIVNLVFDRAASTGPRLRLAMNGLGNLIAEAFDGTTTRTVTTSASYNTAQWLKARVSYTTDGTLAILVNGREVAATRGAPLLTLNNASAVLTIGNSFALDAPFPGSIALLKLGATVPTPEQATFMFEQEKQMFRAGALSVLPDSGAIVDMAYDDATDRWVAISATNESYWTGLVRNSVTPVPAGSYTRVVAGSGLELAARSTTNPGVDVTIPAYGLREELVKRAEAAARLSREIAVYDFVGGFTANTTNGSTAITNVANLTYPTSYVGARVSGTGIPANTTIVGVSGTTIYLSAAATATATGVSISFLDFILPVGMEAKAVLSAGLLRREGSTQDFTRLFDGFRETIRFAVAPGATAWVQIQATRGASL